MLPQSTGTFNCMATTSGQQNQFREIIRAFLAGDDPYFRTLKARIERFVAFHYSGSTDDRRDLVSDIIRTLLLNLRANKFEGHTLGELHSYILGIARLKVMRAIQRADVNVARLPDGQIEELPDGKGAHPDCIVSDRDFVSKVLAAMDPKNRRLMTLKFRDGWSDQEIADHLKMTKNAVSTALSRAVKKAQELKIVKELLYQKPGDGHLMSEGMDHEMPR